MIRSAPLIDLLDASYDSTQAKDAWHMRVVKALMSLTSARCSASFNFTSGYDDNEFHVRTMEPGVGVGSGDWNAWGLTAMSAPSALSEAMLGRTQGTTLSSVTGLGANLVHTPGWRDCWPAPVIDSLGLGARDANGDGFLVCVGLDRLLTLTPRESRLLTKVATHLGAGDRLRRPKHVRLLDEGRRRRDEARKTTHDTEKALEIWRGLVAGRWSLVDHFDTDGKRFLLAMKNTPKVDKRADLTPRERRVCALAAMGHRDKEIAYMLGLSMASVTASLHRARGKLGVKSRTELARIWTKR